MSNQGMLKLSSIPNRLAALTGLLVAASCLALGQTADQQTQQKSDSEEEVLRLDHELLEARRLAAKGDTTALDRILADDFTATSLNGRMASRAQYLKYSARPNLSFRNFSTDEAKVRIYGDTAVATGRTTVTGRDQGEEFNTRFRYTRVYVKRSGRWQLITSHLTTSATQ